MFFPIFTGLQEGGFSLKLFIRQNRRPDSAIEQVLNPDPDFLRGYTMSLHRSPVA